MSNIQKKPPTIFEDLEIDTSDMLDDPKAFAKRVVDKAAELEAILKSDTSVASYEREIKNSSKDAELPQNIADLYLQIYNESEDIPLAEYTRVIEQARQLVKDLETAFHSRAQIESTRNNSPLSNKRVAHAQHVKLREAYDGYRKFATLFFDYNAPIIKGQSGNFGSALSPFKTYLFEIDGEEFMNHFAVIRRLGMTEELTSLMDLLEYLDATPDAPVTVREVSF